MGALRLGAMAKQTITLHCIILYKDNITYITWSKKPLHYMTGFSFDSAAVKETLLLMILDVYFAQAYITIHCIRVLSCTRQCQILCYGVVVVVRRHHCGHLIHRTVCAVCNEFNVQCSLFNVH